MQAARNWSKIKGMTSYLFTAVGRVRTGTHGCRNKLQSSNHIEPLRFKICSWEAVNGKVAGELLKEKGPERTTLPSYETVTRTGKVVQVKWEPLKAYFSVVFNQARN